MSDPLGRRARRARPMVFVDDLEHPVLDPGDHHHLAKSLRVSTGAEVTVSDGAGRWRTIVFAADAPGSVATASDEIQSEPAPVWELAVGFAPVKGDRPEWVVQKLTELGVDRIVPIISERSVVRWDTTRWAKQAERWRRIAREACMQSRRVWLPVIDDLTTLAASLATEAVASSTGPALADPDGVALGPIDRFVVIGPEGGWAPSERADRRLVSLPGGVLRAETATLAAATIMALHRQEAGRDAGREVADYQN